MLFSAIQLLGSDCRMPKWRVNAGASSAPSSSRLETVVRARHPRLVHVYIYTEVKMKDPTIHKKRKYESPYQVPTLLLRVSSPSFLAWEVSTRSNQGQDTSATTPFGLRGPDTATLFSCSLQPAVLHPTGTGTSSPTKHEVVWPERDSASRQSFSVLPCLSAG